MQTVWWCDDCFVATQAAACVATVRWISPTGVERRELRDAKALLERDDGIVWVDLPACDEEAVAVLAETFGFHPLAVRDCTKRSHVPKLHAYPDNIFIVLNAPELGDAGHVHLLELDQFVGHRFLVTVHGPLGEGVPLRLAMKETLLVGERLDGGRFLPTSPAELAHAVVSSMTRHMETMASGLASRIAVLERRVMRNEMQDIESTLEEIFLVRHELLTLRTLAAQSREVYTRIGALGRMLPEEAKPFVADTADHFDRLTSLCDGEKEFLQGVLDFYQSRTVTKMNIAMERLALLTAIILPITAVSGFYGMNIIANDSTDILQVVIIALVLSAAMVMTFRWARRQGWW